MYEVMKRDGKKAAFDIAKITAAIQKAFQATGTSIHPSVIDLLALRVTADFDSKIKNNAVQVEDIQDSVESILIQSGYHEVAKAYILYRKQREKVRDMKSTLLDHKEMIDSYVKDKSALTHNDATAPFSMGGLIFSNSAAISRNYWLYEVYDEEIAEAHRNADLHIHDLSMLSAVSAGWSPKQLIEEGLDGLYSEASAKPARHLFTLCNQLHTFLGIMQNEWAGTQSMLSFDTYLAPFVKWEQLSFEEVKNAMEALIYGINAPSRWGARLPDIHIAFDWHVPKHLADRRAVIGGVCAAFTYGECQKEMDLINQAFLSVLLKKDGKQNPFRYPIPFYPAETILTSDHPNKQLLFQLIKECGTPRLINEQNADIKALWQGMHFHQASANQLSHAAGEQLSAVHSGSIGTVTINLPRIAYLAEDETDFYVKLDKQMDLAARALQMKRSVLDKLMEAGLYPYTKRYLHSFADHFATIGIVGMNEAGIYANWLKQDLLHEKTQAFAKAVLTHMRVKLIGYQKQYGCAFNLAETMQSTCLQRFAKSDRSRYPQMEKNVHASDAYSAGVFLPPHPPSDLFEQMDLANTLQPLFTAGPLFTIHLEDPQTDAEILELLVKKVLKHYRLPYFQLSLSTQ